MKTGIGVTTYNRPQHLDLWKKNVLKYTDFHITHIADDSKDRKGIALRKNECLRALKDCDYIFLFDDDCFPIKAGWMEFFLDAYKASGQHHFLYLKETSTIIKREEIIYDIPLTEKSITINSYDNCAGCFMFLTKEVIEKVGAFGLYPAPYGFEHAGYTQRINKAGLTPMGPYLCPAGIDEYIYAMDYRFDLPFNKQVKHEPSLKNEFDKLDSYISINREAYFRDIQTIYQPL